MKVWDAFDNLAAEYVIVLCFVHLQLVVSDAAKRLSLWDEQVYKLYK